jgi:hypothetical protein
VLKAITVDNGT